MIVFMFSFLYLYHLHSLHVFFLSSSLQVAPSRGAWSAMPVVSPVAAAACAPMEIEALPRSPGGEKRRLVPG